MTIRLKGTDEIAGYPALKVRKVLRDIGEGQCRVGIFDPLASGPDEKCSQEVAKKLKAMKLVYSRHEDGEEWWQLTAKGHKYARATAGPGLKRDKAAAMLAGLIERAKQLNADLGWPWTITRIIAFGSYIGSPKKKELGDLDVMYDIEERAGLRADQVRSSAYQAARNRAFAEGYRPHNIAEHASAGTIWFEKKLRGRNQRLLRLMRLDSEHAKWIRHKPHRLVFGAKPGRYNAADRESAMRSRRRSASARS